VGSVCATILFSASISDALILIFACRESRDVTKVLVCVQVRAYTYLERRRRSPSWLPDGDLSFLFLRRESRWSRDRPLERLRSDPNQLRQGARWGQYWFI
jgi:hypothetical protein